jgi:hypothetical protein
MKTVKNPGLALAGSSPPPPPYESQNTIICLRKGHSNILKPSYISVRFDEYKKYSNKEILVMSCFYIDAKNQTFYIAAFLEKENFA